MLKKIFLGLALALAAFLIFVATRPAKYHVERSATIAAPTDAVFALVSDFTVFPKWSPWSKRDPSMKTTVSTPPSGLGATYGWDGNDQVGSGRMTITESAAPSRVRERLDFFKPFESTAEVTFDFKPEGTGTKVTWAMDGNNNFIGKAFSVFLDMDKMIGKDFEEGLGALKGLAENKAD